MGRVVSLGMSCQLNTLLVLKMDVFLNIIQIQKYFVRSDLKLKKKHENGLSTEK